jgi:hypothetical protein
VVTVTITNGSGTAIDLVDMQVLDAPPAPDADPVHDPGRVGPAPPAKVAAGKAATFRVALGVKRSGTLQVHVSLSPSRTRATFRPPTDRTRRHQAGRAIPLGETCSRGV